MAKKQKSKKVSYLDITDYLVKKIKDNSYPPGTRLPALVELSEKFKVSGGTIKNAFKILKKERFLRYHYGVGMIVREDLKLPLKTALIVPAAYEKLPELLQGMQEAFSDRLSNIEVMFYKDAAGQHESLKRLKDEGFDGAVIRADLAHSGYGSIRQIQDEKFPLVLIENFYPNANGWHVDAGASEAAKLAVNRLYKMGRTPIAAVCPADQFGAMFIEGFKEAHFALKIDCRRSLVAHIEPGHSAGKSTLTLMELNNPPHSIIYADPHDAVAGYTALKESGFDCRRVQLLSFGEVTNGGLFTHPIAALKRDFRSLGTAAAKLLLDSVKASKDSGVSGKTVKTAPGEITEPGNF